VTPALFVFYFLWKRAWKTLLGCALGLFLFFWAVPGCFLGVETNAQRLSSWYKQMIEPYVFGGVVTSEHHNQSLPGLVFRLTTPSPSFSTYRQHQYTPLEYHNFLSLDRTTAGYLVKGCMAVFAGLVVWTCRTPTTPRHGWRLAAEFSLVALGMLLFSERTWKHHCVTLLLPFAVLTYYLAVCHPGRKLRAYLIGSLVAVVLLMTSTSTGSSASWERFGEGAEVYGAYVWAYLILAAALMVLLRQGGGTADPAVAPPAPTSPSPAG
jgi:alpha-1,2-mannosyltransferase